jgi:Na+-transporting methylmalonyl-CoA/oxaloacetate decarboxylase gamma subunit
MNLSKTGFTEFDDDSKKKITDLEDTYRKKLQLEAPARYWRSKSIKYRKDAIKARNILLGMVIFSAIFFSIILISSPDWIFKNVFKGNTTAIVRWSIVFIALISLLAFAIRAITKVMFSSFHLARDAEERHTLTFFYLALLKDTEINPEDRKLILQSLFSRAETGLLKDDSGPTMPNDIVGKILRN